MVRVNAIAQNAKTKSFINVVIIFYYHQNGSVSTYKNTFESIYRSQYPKPLEYHM